MEVLVILNVYFILPENSGRAAKNNYLHTINGNDVGILNKDLGQNYLQLFTTIHTYVPFFRNLVRLRRDFKKSTLITKKSGLFWHCFALESKLETIKNEVSIPKHLKTEFEI